MALVGTFGEALKRLRGDTTQAELSRISGVPRGTIASLEGEDGKEPKWNTVVALARGLGVSADAFVAAEEDARQLAEPQAMNRLKALELKAEALDRKARQAGLLGEELNSLSRDVRAIADVLKSNGFDLPPLTVL